MGKPFLRADRNCWYFKYQGKFIRLDPNKKKAHELWERMLASTDLRSRDSLFVDVCEEFLAFHHGQLSVGAFEATRTSLNAFAKQYPRLKASEISPSVALEWVKGDHPGRLRKDGSYGPSRKWALSTQRDAVSILKRVMRWAKSRGFVQVDSLAAMRMQASPPRDVIVDDGAHRKMVEYALQSRNRSFALYLIASHCGTRPQQIRDVEAKNLGPGCQYMIFEKHKTAYKIKKPLIAYASPCMQTLLKILAHSRPTGKLFRNEDGTPLKKDSVAQRMRRMRDDLGLDPKLIAYSYRHTFATESLMAGNDVATVAALMGHTSIAMVSRVYNHLNQKHDHLVEAARRTAEARIKRMTG